MHKKISILIAICFFLIISGCSIPTKNNQPVDEGGNTTATVSGPQNSERSTQDRKNQILPPVPKDKNEAEFYAQLSKDWIAEKHDPMETIMLYERLVNLYPPQSEPRQTTLRYLLDTSLKYITVDRKAKEALDIALKLNEIIPYDFYIQNRIIGAYGIFAEDEIAKGDLNKAMEWATKGLQIRFDPYIMTTKLDIEIRMAKKAIKSGDKAQAITYIEDIFHIINAQENKDIFSNQLTEANKIFSTLKK